VVVSIMLLGAVVGALTVGPLSNRFGRRRSLMLSLGGGVKKRNERR